MDNGLILTLPTPPVFACPPINLHTRSRNHTQQLRHDLTLTVDPPRTLCLLSPPLARDGTSSVSPTAVVLAFKYAQPFGRST